MICNSLRTTNPATILSIVVLVAVVCSLTSAQQQSTTNTVTAPSTGAGAPPNPTPTPPVASCNLTSTKPSPPQQSYYFQTCMVAKFAAYLSLGQDKYIELKNGSTDLGVSTCGNNASTTPATNPKLVINFNCAQLEFEFDETNKTQIFVKAINGKYQLDGPRTFSNSTPMFMTNDFGHYYKCNAEQAIAMGPVPNANSTVHLMMNNVAFEAFRTASGTDFYKVPEECALDSSQVSDLVRIGVGICLVALVALVLVAYFVGRRRWAERSSYESV